MTQQERSAAELFDRAVFEHGHGKLDTAIDLMRDAVIMYAAADSAAAQPSDERTRARSVACRLCGDFLAESERYAEASKIYQEAVDQYSLQQSEEAEVESRRCAHKLLDCIAMLRARPFERLNLLIARYEHLQRQYAAQPAHEMQEAECAAHIARILARRDRPDEAVTRYREALEILGRAEMDPGVYMAIAESNHRLGGLLAYRLNEPAEALLHYRKAIVLYAEYEPYVYGMQQAREMCERAIKELTAIL